jgi:hypothetical protein
MWTMKLKRLPTALMPPAAATIDNPACPARPVVRYTYGRTLSSVRGAASGRCCNQNEHCMEIVGLLRLTRPVMWRFRSAHHSCSESEMRTSEPKPR